MAVLSLFLANQLKAIVQAEALFHELGAPGYAPIRDLIAKNTRFRPDDWIARMAVACADAREAWTDREIADGDWIDGNEDVRDVVARANAWRGVAGAALRFAVASEIPGSDAVLRRHANVDVQVDSFEAQCAELPLFVDLFERLDHEAYDLSQAFLDEGRALVAQMHGERKSTTEAKGARVTETSELAEAMGRIAALAEELFAARALAAARTGKDLPGFDLTYIRAAAGVHGQRSADEPAIVPAAAPAQADIGL